MFHLIPRHHFASSELEFVSNKHVKNSLVAFDLSRKPTQPVTVRVAKEKMVQNVEMQFTVLR